LEFDEVACMRVIFCGNTFAAARGLLGQQLPRDDIVTVETERELANCRSVDVLIPLMFRIDAALLRSLRPRLIQQWGSGLEGVDLEAALALGVAVASVPAAGSNTQSVAEHVLLLTLALLRDLPQAQENLRAGILGAPLGRMLAGRTVCLWGLGATALAIARWTKVLGARLLGITREPLSDKAALYGLDGCYQTTAFRQALAQTDILILCVRLNEHTRGLIDADVLSALPQGAFLVNAARGALIDYEALRVALERKQLGGVGLDVYWQEPFPPGDPLLRLPNVIATPHVAGVTDRSYGEIAAAVASNIEHLRRGEPLDHRVV